MIPSYDSNIISVTKTGGASLQICGFGGAIYAASRADPVRVNGRLGGDRSHAQSCETLHPL